MKVCEYCGKEFEPDNKRGPSSKYCSSNCREKLADDRKRERRHKKLSGRQCKNCGKLLDRQQPTYCNKTCYYLDNFGTRDCVECGKTYIAKRDAQKCCGDECSRKKAHRTKKGQRDTSIVKTCVVCGQEFNPYKGKLTQVSCSEYCKRRKDSISKAKSGYKRRINQRRNLIISATESESFDKVEIFERDKWICQVCRRKVNRNLSYPNPMSASLDHILPMALGGGHTQANVQLAHLRCNIKKSHTGGAQLRLIG